MQTELASYAAAVVGILFAQVLRFQAALLALSKVMAAMADKGLAPIYYQNSITPPWLVNAFFFLVVALVGCISVAGVFGGIQDVVVAALFSIGGCVLTQMASNFIARPRQITYYKLAFHTLANRAADYSRDGDVQRAAAAEYMASLVGSAVGPALLE